MSQLIPFMKYLDTVGDGSGTTNAIGDYSGATTVFKTVCSSGSGMTVQSLLIHISGNSNFTLTGYGNGVALTNGVTLQANIGGVSYVFNSAFPIKSNDDWAHISPSINHLTFVGSGDSLVIPFLVADFGIPLVLGLGDSLQVNLHDSFTGLVSQHFIAKGYTN